MQEYGSCYKCGAYGCEIHHIQKRSQVKALKDCKYNLVYLCSNHHRGQEGVHSGNTKLDHELKLMFQNKLEMLFLKDYFTREEIRDTLKIKDKQADSLCKLMACEKGKYSREEIIKACMGGKLIMEGD